MGKGEIARYEQFLLFPQCFQKACFPGASKGVIVWEWVKGSVYSIKDVRVYKTKDKFKGGYLDFSHLAKFKKKIYITEIYIIKQNKSSLTKNHKITQKTF